MFELYLLETRMESNIIYLVVSLRNGRDEWSTNDDTHLQKLHYIPIFIHISTCGSRTIRRYTIQENVYNNGLSEILIGHHNCDRFKEEYVQWLWINRTYTGVRFIYRSVFKVSPLQNGLWDGVAKMVLLVIIKYIFLPLFLSSGSYNLQVLYRSVYYTILW